MKYVACDDRVIVTDLNGHSERYDHVVMASHADQALAMLADPSARRAKSARLVPLQPQSRRAAHRRQLHAEAARGLVKLELYRLTRHREQWRLRDLLDEPPAEHRERKAAVRHPQSAAAAARRNAAPQRGLRSSDLRCEGDGGSTQAVAAARRAKYLVLRRVFRRGFHEDGLQAGLAVAEQLGDVRRPWQVPNESGRIVLTARSTEAAAPELQT